ncbi:MAG: cation diffusion facilitator family transporter [Gammaproteobacteria bacterium]|jgi:ferrous-iron efflux pump FieF|nr:cation diffusion facilitator family transporter [Gammaproteobacteria bacterium]MDP6615624.1 cation diffusion facilitator family transporter [Gammaproteobacteria bacterium]MDP6695871.1 cation diffusion facilitator family transporter [Gammaproteobacteria bacterium]
MTLLRLKDKSTNGKHTMSTANPEAKKKARMLQRAASYASIGVALVLVIAKIWAWQETNSVSILSSLVDSFLDVLASSITMIGVRVALQPADSEHRFGHGKSEGLVALTQAIIITLSAVYVLLEAVQRLTSPMSISKPEIGIGVMAVSIGLTAALLIFQRMVVKRTNSMAISADAMHYRSDLLVNLGVMIAIPLTAWTGLTLIDPIVGIAIAVYILWGTYDVGRDALDVLLDRELPYQERALIEATAMAHAKVLGFHDLRTRYSGQHHFIQFHLELDPDTTLLDTHIILDEVEDTVRELYPEAELIVHADPLGFQERRDAFD